ncbi:MAG: hypothetical protein FRX49_06894 [Trebouxia sp. A1-2]|nr:MAG: hypothetical protein FRX49_06894 [Trebouxia sp. A1-2]
MSPVQLVDLAYMNKHELPMPKPLPGFSTPVLVMVGDQDVVVDVEAAQETAQHFGQAEAVELQGAAHDLMLAKVGHGEEEEGGMGDYSNALLRAVALADFVCVCEVPLPAKEEVVEGSVLLPGCRILVARYIVETLPVSN